MNPPSASPATLLIVEDNPVVRFGVAHLLRAAGFDVLEAGDGGEGLRLAAERRPDLVLMDVLLPDGNGVDFCRAIKRAGAEGGPLVVLLSSIDISPAQQAGGLEAGADGYIARPVENRELLARVQAMLRLRAAEEALRRGRDELEQRVAERTAELRALSLKLVEVQETERRFLARELHDDFGQRLTGAKMVLEMALRECGNPAAPGRAKVEEALGVIGELLAKVRQLSLDLRPQLLDDLGLVIALEWHLRRFEQQTGLPVQFKRGPLPGRPAPALETAAFRIAQEALTNVARHARARAATVRLWLADGRLAVQVEDNGAGFDAEAALAARASTGLAGMRERAVLLGGSFTLDSAPGAGTRLTAELPWAVTAS